jgi:Nuclease-related domain
MRVIDFAPPEPEAGALDNLISRGRELLNMGDTGLKAQESIVTRLKRGLDNRFTLFTNVLLEGLDVPVPMILVGPAGIYVLYVSGEKGVFQAKEESWREMGGATRHFQPARQNLIKIAMLLARVVDNYLTKNEVPHPEVQSVLIFAHPGVHVDSIRPAVRIVLMDAVERLITDIIRSSDVLMPGDIRAIVEALEKAKGRVVAPKVELEGEGRTRIPVQRKLPPQLEKLAEAEIPMPAQFAKMRFSRRQWTLLGVIALFEICFLMAFIFYVILTAE